MNSFHFIYIRDLHFSSPCNVHTLSHHTSSTSTSCPAKAPDFHFPWSSNSGPPSSSSASHAPSAHAALYVSY